MPIHEAQLNVERPGFMGGGQWTLSRLNSVSVLLGRNGSGKSLLLRALRDQAPASRHYIVPERTGEINFEANLIAEVINAQSRRNRSASNFSANYRQEVVTRIQGYYTKRGTKRIADINHDPETLLKSLNLILPDFTTSVRSETPFYDLKRIKDGSAVTSVSSFTGERRPGIERHDQADQTSVEH